MHFNLQNLVIIASSTLDPIITFTLDSTGIVTPILSYS
jgi:hypothetical protein